MKMFSLRHLWFAGILLFAFGCEKDPAPPVVNPPDPPDPYEQYGTPFSDVPSNDNIVMYEVNLRAFSAGGDLQGVINRLDEIKALGVNVIWLMPIHPIGTIKSVNSPYCVRDYKAVSPEYGSLETLRTLTTEAHARGMTVIMDWIANHTSWDNPWISNGSWYTQDVNGTIIHPAGTNWQDVADLNFNSNAMRKAMIDAMKYWVLEANVDGYRCDYADGVPFDFWKQAIDTLHAIPDRDLIMLAEGSRADHFTAGFDLNYAWDFYGAIKNAFSGQSAKGVFTTHANEYNGVPAGKHLLRFTTNHDQSAWETTPMVLFNGKQGALAASVATIFLEGVPLFYTGQEVGRVATVPFFSNSPINWNDNPDMLQAYKDIMAFYTQSDVARLGVNEDHFTNEAVMFTKTLGAEQLFILVNTRNAVIEPVIPDELEGLFWTDALQGDTLQFGATVQMSNYQYIIARR
jgi:1,4-alpha-glucan branching enzyme